MRWNFKDFEQTPELSSDLEWMIQSGQVSREFILETLVTQFYEPVYLLAISLLDDRYAARTVTRETFVRLVLNLHLYRSNVGVKNWVYQIAYQACIKKLRGEGVWRYLDKILSTTGQFTEPLIVQPPTESDRDLWNRMDGLDQSDRTLLILRYANEWEISAISWVTGIEEDMVISRLQSSLELLMNTHNYSQDEAQLVLINSMSMRWKPIAIPDVDMEQFVKQISRRTGKKRSWRREISTAREMVLLGLALLFVMLIIWGGNRYLLRTDTNLDPSGSLRPQPTWFTRLVL